MKKSIFIIAIFALISLVGCEKKYERTIWVNPDIECCGVKDPLNNLEWLKEIYDMRFKQYEELEPSIYTYEYIFLFGNDSISTNYVVRKANMCSDSWFGIYACDGTFIDGGVFYNETLINEILDSNYEKQQIEEAADKCDLCEEFFKSNTLIDTISYYIIHP